jgi:two-component system response regulator
MNPVLYAEDEEDDVFFLRKAFEKAGINNPLVIAPDGLAAIEYLSGKGQHSERAEHPLPCLALLDLNLPNKSGLEILEWIRAQSSLSALPVLILTSSTQEADVHRAYRQGANGFLVKPGRPDELLAMVKAIRDFWLIHNRGVRDVLKYSAAVAASG